jgi:hypothetical protein
LLVAVCAGESPSAMPEKAALYQFARECRTIEWTKPLCTESAEVFLGLKVPLLKYDVVILAIASISMVF